MLFVLKLVLNLSSWKKGAETYIFYFTFTRDQIYCVFLKNIITTFRFSYLNVIKLKIFARKSRKIVL